MSSIQQALHESHAEKGIHRPACKLCTPQPERVHYVRVEADRPDEDGWRGEPTVKFECRAHPGAKCRTYPNCDCDGWPCDHPEVPQDECWMQGWFDNEGHYYSGENSESCEETGLPRDTNREGFIEGSYDGDCLTWEWAA